MNTKNILVAALLVSAAGLSAFSISASADDNVAQGKTRAEVKAELIQAHSGNWSPADDESYTPQPFVSTKTRAQVKAELVQARANGWRIERDDDYPVSQPFVSTRTRADVKAELVQARAQQAASGQHDNPEN
jgi:hypothetical protein